MSNLLGNSRIEITRTYAKVTNLMKRDALKKLSEGEDTAFKSDVPIKYFDDEARGTYVA